MLDEDDEEVRKAMAMALAANFANFLMFTPHGKCWTFGTVAGLLGGGS